MIFSILKKKIRKWQQYVWPIQLLMPVYTTKCDVCPSQGHKDSAKNLWRNDRLAEKWGDLHVDRLGIQCVERYCDQLVERYLSVAKYVAQSSTAQTKQNTESVEQTTSQTESKLKYASLARHFSILEKTAINQTMVL